MSAAVRKALALFVFVLLAFTILDFIFGSASPSMEFAERAIRESPKLAAQLGTVRSVRLRIWGYGNRPGGFSSKVTLKLFVQGEHGSAKIDLELEGNDSTWKILSSSMAI